MKCQAFQSLVGIIALTHLGVAPIHAQDEEKLSIVMHCKTPKELKVAKWGKESIPSPMMAFKASKLMPGNGDPIDDAVIITHNSKIVAVGKARAELKV